jgi:hypothetical protein
MLPNYGLLGFNFLEEKQTNCAHCVGLCMCVCFSKCVLQDFSSKKSSCTSSKLLKYYKQELFTYQKFYAQLGLIFKNRILNWNFFSKI